MAETLNLSLSPGQLAWIKSRKAGGGYASASDFIRDLIRREQEKEWTTLQASFLQMSKDGAPGPEPVEEIMAVVRKVKRERRRK
jgi:antitoxin ParD1/3/4